MQVVTLPRNSAMIASFSSSGGEGVRRADEEVFDFFREWRHVERMNKRRIAGQTAKRRAKLLRKQLTGPERKLWELLRNRRLKGSKFRRQYPIGPYIVDFYHAEQKLIVELDGNSHADRGTQDQRRQSWLETEGYRVIRFSNDDILNDDESVLLGILKALGKPIPQ